MNIFHDFMNINFFKSLQLIMKSLQSGPGRIEA